MLNDEGFGHKLLSLLPIARHATFRVRLTIHQVANIPLIRGSFALKWRFKNVVHSHNGSRGDLSGLSTPASVTPTVKGHDAASRKTTPEPPTRFTRAEKGKERAPDSPPDAEEEDGFHTSPLMTLPNGSTSATNGKYGKFLSPAVPPSPTRPGPKAFKSSASSVHTSFSSSSDQPHNSTAKGSTPFVAIKDHAVTWDHTVEVDVEMKVRRETGDLLPAELKLIILEDYISGVDTPQTQHGRLGIVLLNLAEYAGAGPVTRRYLLRDSKSNATLKMTIEAIYLSGEKHFKAPPLQTGQAVAGVAGVLSSDHIRSFVNFNRSRSNTVTLRPSIGSRTVSPNPQGDSIGHGPSLDGHRPASFRRASSATESVFRDPLVGTTAGPSAEEIIEIIFNPWPTTSVYKAQHPFYYSAPAPPVAPTIPSSSPSVSEENDDQTSVSVSAETAYSVPPSPTEFGARPWTPASSTGGGGGWWRRIGGSHGSRPSTPSNPPTIQPHPPKTLTRRRPGTAESAESHTNRTASSATVVSKSLPSRTGSYASSYRSTSSLVIVVDSPS